MLTDQLIQTAPSSTYSHPVLSNLGVQSASDSLFTLDLSGEGSESIYRLHSAIGYRRACGGAVPSLFMCFRTWETPSILFELVVSPALYLAMDLLRRYD